MKNLKLPHVASAGTALWMVIAPMQAEEKKQIPAYHFIHAVDMSGSMYVPQIVSVLTKEANALDDPQVRSCLAQHRFSRYTMIGWSVLTKDLGIEGMPIAERSLDKDIQAIQDKLRGLAADLSARGIHPLGGSTLVTGGLRRSYEIAQKHMDSDGAGRFGTSVSITVVTDGGLNDMQSGVDTVGYIAEQGGVVSVLTTDKAQLPAFKGHLNTKGWGFSEDIDREGAWQQVYCRSMG